jgi:hypothetical protein
MWYVVAGVESVVVLLLIAVTIWERRHRRSRLAVKLPLFVVFLALLAWRTYLSVIGEH